MTRRSPAGDGYLTQRLCAAIHDQSAVADSFTQSGTEPKSGSLNSATADLTPIRALPVESLRITLDGGNLSPLQDHRHLHSLDLSSTAEVDITPLTTVPYLRGLDLSGADVSDLTVLAGLPDLRYLALTSRQWAVVLDQGKTPPGLAAACLADEEASFDQALTWAARLGLDTGDALRVTGTL